MPNPRRFLALAACIALGATSAIAQDAAAPAAGTNTRPLWEIGVVAGGISQQAYPGSDRQVNRGLVLPWATYRGRYLRADGESIGVRAVRTPVYEFDISVAGAFGSRANDDPVRRGMPDLGTLVEFGPRLRVNLGGTAQDGLWRLDLPLRGVFDISDSFAYRGTIFQPGVSWSRRLPGAWNLGTSASLVIADERLSSTFYEVEPVYATATRPAYEAKAGLLATRLSASLTKNLSRDWTVYLFARADTVAGAANRHSPLVSRTTGFTAGAGLSWTWLRSSEAASD
ncbi:MipA/OmpV family protein [Caenimonas sedimenti]|uniref:MipA/OmpV family protein n=1 Tax=Caenimonas sedimenti TaxID=2596921 RepID=A0A562ZLW5_9BURK|nr:MipA/OmpV family protein [Caenimonas sedimenti]TWO69483.1 MipA/OmpV family protein [Caenimonas sedimenti]